ncbi:hypothetical protein LOTGIDRAFT_175388 [Lottia gigantea]|uniref:NHR domain-containing protein n=1 Tax=Lottia gigantea TaxID=225164 RepID=V4BZR2_LOTGI|nr:hypothetical protein LOTGIDRAFT_175388 [Lottia gigantea]ESO94649.1 hypothetical protein LOTGIDRAFT_175388 [Lottia gigantea]
MGKSDSSICIWQSLAVSRNALMERAATDGVDGNNRLKVAPIKKPDLSTKKEEETVTTIDISKYKKNGKWTILPLSVIPKLSLPDLSTIYHRYLDQNIQYECKDRLRMGKITDGGWDVCADEPYRPTKDGFVYSFGVHPWVITNTHTKICRNSSRIVSCRVYTSNCGRTDRWTDGRTWVTAIYFVFHRKFLLTRNPLVDHVTSFVGLYSRDDTWNSDYRSGL